MSGSSRGLRVLQVIDSLAPAGAEQSLVAVAPHLVSRGIDVHVAHLSPPDTLRHRLEQHGIAVTSLQLIGSDRVEAIRRVRSLLDQVKPDLLHTTLFEADVAGRVAARSARIPSVSTWANTAYGNIEIRQGGNHWLKVRAAQALDAATAQLASRFHAVTPHVAEVMRRRLVVPRARVDVVFRGRDPDVLGTRSTERRARARSSLGIDGETPLVLAVARQEPQKGLDVLVTSVPSIRREVPAAVVAVAGREGRSTADLRGLVAALPQPDAVRLLGARSDVPDLLCAADVFVLPSRWEGAAGSVLEAMALECPIVASDLRTLVGTVNQDTAALVPVDDPGALAAAITATIVRPADSRDRASRAKRHFDATFTVSASADGMADFYRRAVTL